MLLWWVGLHGVVGASLALLPVPAAADALGTVLLLAHAWSRRPRQAPELLLFHNDWWALPDRGRFGLRPLAGTVYTALWLHLILADPTGATIGLLLLRDQFGAEAWRKIQVAVRECDNGAGKSAAHPSAQG